MFTSSIPNCKIHACLSYLVRPKHCYGFIGVHQPCSHSFYFPIIFRPIQCGNTNKEEEKKTYVDMSKAVYFQKAKQNSESPSYLVFLRFIYTDRDAQLFYKSSSLIYGCSVTSVFHSVDRCIENSWQGEKATE